VFDRVKFTIAVDDLNDTELIHEGYDWLNSIIERGNGIEREIRVIKNDEFREARTFYEKVIKNNEDDELIFFFHTKGVSNFKNEMCVQESIFLWAAYIYYVCLEKIDEMEASLCDTPKNTYGGLLTSSEKRPQDFPFIYSGTGFWLNMNGHRVLRETGILKDLPLYTKYYAENYYGNFLTFFQSFGMDSPKHTWFSFEDVGPSTLYGGDINGWNFIIETTTNKDLFWCYVNELCDNVQYYL
jgi:hypothetical protein